MLCPLQWPSVFPLKSDNFFLDGFLWKILAGSSMDTENFHQCLPDHSLHLWRPVLLTSIISSANIIFRRKPPPKISISAVTSRFCCCCFSPYCPNSPGHWNGGHKLIFWRSKSEKSEKGGCIKQYGAACFPLRNCYRTNNCFHTRTTELGIYISLL